MLTIEHGRNRNLIVLRASGRLTDQDIEDAAPELRHALELADGPLRAMVRLEDFQGSEVEALWRELRLALEHRGDFDRIAVLGESRLEEWITGLAAPLGKAETRFFPAGREEEAETWLQAG